jgi:FMN phosphatase YigB (HAD superfamily)
VYGVTKPNPGIFNEALRRAGVRPDQVIHVGDSYEEAYLGATPLGITCFLLDRNGVGNGKTVEEKYRISTLAELRDQIK